MTQKLTVGLILQFDDKNFLTLVCRRDDSLGLCGSNKRQRAWFAAAVLACVVGRLIHRWGPVVGRLARHGQVAEK